MNVLKITRIVPIPAHKKLTWDAPLTAKCFIQKIIFAATSFENA
ncbi:hypothetical protein [Methylovulum sp.]|nr:hypothetical protein [Methylovulum sp.]